MFHRLVVFLGAVWLGLGTARASEPGTAPRPDFVDSLLRVARATPPGPAQVQALLRLSNVYNQTDSVRALAYGRRGLAAARQQGQDSLVSQALITCGSALYYQGQSARALAHYQQALALQLRSGLWRRAADCYLGIGAAQMAAGHQAEAVEAYQRALPLHRRAKNWARVAGCYSDMGIAYYEQANYPAALRCFQTGLRIAEHSRDREQAAHMLVNIGGLYELQANLPLALQYNLRALRLFRAIHKQVWVSEVLNTVGRLYTRQKDYDLAHRYLQENLRLEEQLGNWNQKATTLLTLGQLYLEQERFALAVPPLRQAAALCQQLAMRERHFSALYCLAAAYQHTGQLPLAWRYAHLALHVTQTHRLPFERKDALEQLAQLSAARHDSAAAYRYQQRYQALKDSLDKQENLQQLAELQTRYETQKKEAQIGLLRRNAALQQAHLRGQQRLRDLLAGGLLLVALMGGLYYRRYRQQRHANHMLREQEARIAAQNAEITNKNRDLLQTQLLLRKSLGEKDVLLKEVHHRVKNNLQIISSLLSFQLREQQQPHVTAVLREGQNWIKAIALIHEMLYRSDDLAHINAQQFLQRLADLLGQTFGSQGIRLDVQAAAISLNTSTAVPLGLIVNELISNAYKHAFPAGGPGHILVQLEETAAARYQLSVSDDGAGLPADFSLDFTSLGLQLVQNLTEQLDGTLQVHRRPGGGTRFTIRFDAVAEETLPAPSRAEA